MSERENGKLRSWSNHVRRPGRSYFMKLHSPLNATDLFFSLSRATGNNDGSTQFLALAPTGRAGGGATAAPAPPAAGRRAGPAAPGPGSDRTAPTLLFIRAFWQAAMG
jgi:hypothetical protein